MFFDGWTNIGRTVLGGFIAYAFLVALLRTSGKRTLAKMNAFDLVVTVALGSTLSSVLVSRDVPLTDGLAAFTVLVVLQFTVAWTSVRSRRVERIVKSDPTLLVYRGVPRHDAMRQQRVSEEELRAAVRRAGLGRPDDAGGVILETDGTFSVIPFDALPPPEEFEGIGRRLCQTHKSLDR